MLLLGSRARSPPLVPASVWARLSSGSDIGELSKPDASEEFGVSVPAGEPDPAATISRRAGTIELVFAQIKHNRKIRTTSCRDLAAADSEWKLICTTHNLLKLYRMG